MLMTDMRSIDRERAVKKSKKKKKRKEEKKKEQKKDEKRNGLTLWLCSRKSAKLSI